MLLGIQSETFCLHGVRSASASGSSLVFSSTGIYFFLDYDGRTSVDAVEMCFALNLTFFVWQFYIYIYLAFYMEHLKKFTDILIVLSYRDAIYLRKITLVKYSLKHKVLKIPNTIMFLNLAKS